jgi:HEPN domain-containing protein
MKRETARSVRKAEADRGGARILHRVKSPKHDLTCFHCQKCVEKYFKALIQEWRLPAPPRTHDLRTLLLLLVPHDATLRKLGRGLKTLTTYAVDVRYPMKDASKRQANAALRKGEKVRSEIRQRLGLSP